MTKIRITHTFIWIPSATT